MRIAVVNLTSGGLSGGYRKYLDRLMPLLANSPRVRELTVFVPRQAALTAPDGVTFRDWDAGTVAGQAALRVDVGRLRPDVVFIPTARFMRFGDVPVVTMVRNMEPLSVPFGGHTVREGLRNLARARAAKRASRRAKRVIAVSQHVRDFLVSRWGVRDDRVAIVRHGVDPVAGGRDRETATILAAGSIRPARGLEDVIRALALLPPSVRLIIAGRVDPPCVHYGRRLRRLAATTGVDRDIVWSGQLDPAAMADALTTATVFAMTSRAEACPNIALEAMSAGCPVVSVTMPPMPEFFGDGAMYYPAGDQRALAAQLQMLLDDRSVRMSASGRARARAARYDWGETRDRTLDELERAR